MKHRYTLLTLFLAVFIIALSGCSSDSVSEEGYSTNVYGGYAYPSYGYGYGYYDYDDDDHFDRDFVHDYKRRYGNVDDRLKDDHLVDHSVNEHSINEHRHIGSPISRPSFSGARNFGGQHFGGGSFGGGHFGGGRGRGGRR